MPESLVSTPVAGDSVSLHLGAYLQRCLEHSREGRRRGSSSSSSTGSRSESPDIVDIINGVGGVGSPSYFQSSSLRSLQVCVVQIMQ